jgi:SAM-dependent methyltransferase
MTFSKEWEESYRQNVQMALWPWTDIVVMVMKYARPTANTAKVLELGCGPGANIPFLLSLGLDYYAIDGSESVVQNVRERFPQCAQQIVVGDFTEKIPFEMQFDLVIDRASLPHNTHQSIKKCLALVWQKMTPNAKYVGVDWFGVESTDFHKGKVAGDEFCRSDAGFYVGMGPTHFFTRSIINDLFDRFKMVAMEEKKMTRYLPEEGWAQSTWNFVAQKV